MKFKYVIFDLDGTLDNSMPAYTVAFVQACAEQGLTNPEIGKRYNLTAGTPLREQFSREAARANQPLDLERSVTRFWKIMEGHLTEPFPEAGIIIPALHQADHTLYCTTGSKTEKAIRKLREMELYSYFKLILGGELELEKGLKHLSRFKEDSGDSLFEQRAVYVGDGTADMRFAREFGMTAIGIATTLPKEVLREAGANQVINNLRELLPLLN